MERTLEKVKDFVDIVQLDVMDNKFVPNASLWFNFSLPIQKVQYEAHLMVSHPMSWISSHIDQIDTFLFHYESSVDIDEAINIIRDAGRSVGIVINPETSVEKIQSYLDLLDQVLVMTVNPGFYGSPFLPENLEKIRQIRHQYPNIDLEVDGGITADTIKVAAQAGANKFVSGSFIVKSPNPQKSITQLNELLTKHY
ncbi:MAG: ribulose-phosphate 3-epimerase [Candidatus Thermoplasmatota archaeon]|nr:ribulose-phosphate 3-epimerase [Candidatus Thermoplasmatota archaeon]MBU1941022.1 ribulose-phosphate 3-epimerase [Candidatus Thermoplasmatota archaeon]